MELFWLITKFIWGLKFEAIAWYILGATVAIFDRIDIKGCIQIKDLDNIFLKEAWIGGILVYMQLYIFLKRHKGIVLFGSSRKVKEKEMKNNIIEMRRELYGDEQISYSYPKDKNWSRTAGTQISGRNRKAIP